MFHSQDLFSAVLDPPQDCEREYITAEVTVREKLGYLFVTLHLVLLSNANSAVPNQMPGNICLGKFKGQRYCTVNIVLNCVETIVQRN